MVLGAIIKYLTEVEDVTEARRKASFGHPSAPIAILVFYVLFCKWLGPALMKHRKPFDLKPFIITYNFGQMLLNAYLVYRLSSMGLVCWEIRCLGSASPLHPILTKGQHAVALQIYLVKYLDLIDTVLFVLRKKDKQISFLHVFHHVTMCCFVYIVIYAVAEFRYYSLFIIGINTFVHVIMYLYYTLAAFGPSMQKYLWWKKYLTLMQMLQFVIILLYMSVNFATGCQKADAPAIGACVFTAAVLALFGNFYRKTFKTD